MSGRDLIIYILSNGLENEPVYKDGKLLGFMTAAEAAMKFGVGIFTVEMWVDMDMLEGIRIGDELYIPANADNPLNKEMTNE